MDDRTTIRAVEAGISVFIVLLLLAEVLLNLPAARPSIVEQDILTGEANSTVFAQSTLTATFSAHTNSVDFVKSPIQSFPTVYYYFDPLYPVSYSDIQDWYGLTQHLSVVADARGYVLHLQLVNASQLALLLQNPTTEKDLLVMASGVLPANVFTGQRNLVRPWLAGGGTLFWLGDLIGAYSGQPGSGSVTLGPGTPGKNGTSQFFNVSWLGGNATLYDGSSPFVSAFAFQYPYGIRDHALNATAVAASGAAVLGPVVNGFTNLAAIPIGNGTLVNLAAPPYDVIRLSISLVNLLQTGVLSSHYQVLRHQTMTLTPGVAFLTKEWVMIPSPFLSLPSAEFCRFTTQIDYLALFGSISCIAI